MMFVKEKLARFFEGLSEKITYRHWIAIAATASVLLGLLVFAGLGGSDEAEEAPPANTVRIVVAKQDIAPKTILKESMLEQREVPSYMVPEEAVKEVSEVVNRPAKEQILKDDIITTRRVLMDITMAGFTGEIPPECRAITIGISDITGVAGFAKPGDYVDVMLITKGDDKMVGRMVLQDVQVLAINNIAMGPQKQENASSGDVVKTGDGSGDASVIKENNNADAQGEEKPISNLTTATLAVLPADALKLITEAQEGTLYLALRPYKPRDKFTTDTRYTHYSTIKSNTKSTAPAAQSAPPAASYAAPAPAAPARSGGGVEVIRGTTTTREGA